MQALEFIGELSCDSGSMYRPYKIMYPVNASKWPEKGKNICACFSLSSSHFGTKPIK